MHVYCPKSTCGTSARSSLRPKPSTLLSLVCSLESSTSVVTCIHHVTVHIAIVNHCRSSLRPKPSTLLSLVCSRKSSTWTKLFMSHKTSQTGVCSGWSHGSHIHPWDWPIIADLQSTTNPIGQAPPDCMWPEGRIRMRINNWYNCLNHVADCTWTGNLPRQVFWLTGQRFGLVLQYTQAFKSHNGLQVTQKIHRHKHSGSCLGSWD